jgi:hypothetical protein
MIGYCRNIMPNLTDEGMDNYRVFRTQADWTFILPPELPAQVLRHLPRKMPPRDTTYWEV